MSNKHVNKLFVGLLDAISNAPDRPQPKRDDGYGKMKQPCIECGCQEAEINGRCYACHRCVAAPRS